MLSTYNYSISIMLIYIYIDNLMILLPFENSHSAMFGNGGRVFEYVSNANIHWPFQAHTHRIAVRANIWICD